MDKNKAGLKFHNWTKKQDFTHRQIDKRTERKENEPIKNHKEVNENGRLWSF